MPLLMATCRREAGELLTLNALILLASLPVVTIPAAQAAGLRITLRMLDDAPIYLWRDFWRAFRSCFLLATTFGVVAACAALAAGWTSWIYAQMAGQHVLYVVPFVIAASVALLVCAVAAQGFVLIAADTEARPHLLRRAVFATLARPLPILSGLTALAALWLSVAILYPVSVLLPATVAFSFGSLIAAFAMRPVAETCTAGNRASTEEEN
ncbi:uncharacterized protein DUF624 [Pseudoroseicyclus aestuarii]|uniref:Uncharacterized protein DUF624 n=2 Tax=Pseudoroseicyclus aestuarii TaxID=1795041 RepID=A0A318T703_9RHOB|nr:uncharacterized protein DUF624 [Pseudoroseicyclus aestuarii]